MRITGHGPLLRNPNEPSRAGSYQTTTTTEQRPDGSTSISQRTICKFDPEDVIALFAGLVALIIAGAMACGALSVNALTIGVLGFSGVGTAIAQMVKSKKRGRAK